MELLCFCWVWVIFDVVLGFDWLIWLLDTFNFLDGNFDLLVVGCIVVLCCFACLDDCLELMVTLGYFNYFLCFVGLLIWVGVFVFA